MIAVAGLCDVERFRAAIAHRLGLQFDDARFGFLGAVLQRRLAQVEMPASHYLCQLEAGTLAAEPAALAAELTVGETYFFRNSEQFRALVEIVLPARMRAAAHGRKLSVLSAGCASGEEPYSLAIALHEAIPDPGWEIAIRAVDINPAALARAARAHYSPWALRETPANVQHRWFRPAGRELVLADAARTGVHFENRNLAADDAALWRPQSFDVVFCRNVIMYFAPEEARALLARIIRSLCPGGYLFLGHAETLRGLSNDLCLRHTHGTFYYQRADEPPPATARHFPPLSEFAAPAAADPPGCDDGWAETVRGASDRVTALAAAMQATQRPPEVAAERWDLAAALDLLRGERFAEALALIGRLPPASADDRELLLLKAAVLAHGGQPIAAEAACGRLLSIDCRNAGARYVLALCREAAGDAAGAAGHDRIAAYLDPAFAMPRLHLGLLARRAGDRDAARRELAQAQVLLQRENPSRLLLFGGGFGRAGLISLCAAALRECGGNP
jgi:chemotaxis protein methyltransferase CheR